jgi:hypothetical protein
MEDKMIIIDADSGLFAPTKNIMWDIDETIYTQAQKQKII